MNNLGTGLAIWYLVITIPFAVGILRMPHKIRGILLGHPFIADLIVSGTLAMLGGASVAASAEFRMLLVTWVILSFAISFIQPRTIIVFYLCTEPHKVLDIMFRLPLLKYLALALSIRCKRQDLPRRKFLWIL